MESVIFVSDLWIYNFWELGNGKLKTIFTLIYPSYTSPSIITQKYVFDQMISVW